MPEGQQSVITSDLIALLELYEAAERALCEQLRAHRLAGSTSRLFGELGVVAPRLEAGSSSSAIGVGPDLGTLGRLESVPASPSSEIGFDPVKAKGGHRTKRDYNYFAQLATDLAQSVSVTRAVPRNGKGDESAD